MPLLPQLSLLSGGRFCWVPRKISSSIREVKSSISPKKFLWAFPSKDQRLNLQKCLRGTTFTFREQKKIVNFHLLFHYGCSRVSVSSFKKLPLESKGPKHSSSSPNLVICTVLSISKNFFNASNWRALSLLFGSARYFERRFFQSSHLTSVY